jgi:hypothetical protein
MEFLVILVETCSGSNSNKNRYDTRKDSCVDGHKEVKHKFLLIALYIVYYNRVHKPNIIIVPKHIYKKAYAGIYFIQYIYV